MRNNSEVKQMIKDTLGFEIEWIDSKIQVGHFENSKRKIYVQFGGVPVETFSNHVDDGINFCLFTRKDNTPFYWADFNTWYAIYKTIKDNPQIENDTTSLLNKKIIQNVAGIEILEKNGSKEDTARFINRIKEDLQLDTLKEQLKDLLTNGKAKQIICHGAPGTGKTYAVTHLPELLEGPGISIDEELKENFVQFHPSYDYTDFVEGLRPVRIKVGDADDPNTEGKETTAFVRLDGTFKAFCRQVIRKNKDKSNAEKNYIFIIDEINRADLSKVFGELMYCLEEGNRGENKKIQTQYKNVPCYEIDKAGTAKKIKEDEFSDGFYIPQNVIVIGTMNDIDRSVETFDFAMQRRFSWIYVDADSEMQNDVFDRMFVESEENGNESKENENLATKLIKNAKNLNSEIEKLLGKDYTIGHAYYKKFAQYYKSEKPEDETDIINENAFKKAMEKVWKYSLEQILKSYFRGRKDGENDISKCKNAFLGIED